MTETAGTKEERVSRGAWIWLAGVLVVAVALVAMYINGSGTSGGNDDEEPYDMNNTQEAIAQCEHFVKERLKAPATAQFDLTAERIGTWIVTGTVDSHNGFGAMIRSDVECEIRMNNTEGKAELYDIKIG